jgi:hypothetical protein
MVEFKKDFQITVKECGICNKTIFLNQDNYVHIEDFCKGQFFTEGYYHLKCYNDKLKGTQDAEMNKMKKKAYAMLDKASKMLGMKDDDDVEVVHI